MRPGGRRWVAVVVERWVLGGGYSVYGEQSEAQDYPGLGPGYAQEYYRSECLVTGSSRLLRCLAPG